MDENFEEVKKAVSRLSKDLREAARMMSKEEVRFLVDAYYIMQEDRKRSANQVRALSESEEPHEILKWFAINTLLLEGQVKGALDVFSRSSELGQWARSVKGIGPVITAGLLAHIDLNIAVTAGHIWRFAGLDPTMKWEKGQKRPWNAKLKVLCWKIGESFVKQSGKDDAFYGKLYVQRKEYETEKNEKGDYADQAAEGKERVGKSTEAYKHYAKGKLPPGHIHSRAKRYAVKLFLAHYHEKGRGFLGLPVPNPYPLDHLGHTHKIEPPE